MSWQRLTGQQPPWPNFAGHAVSSNFSSPSGATLDAAGEYWYTYGRIHWDGGGSHTVSSSGGKVHFRVGTVAWASGSEVRAGLQDVNTAAGPPFRPDGTFDVYDDLVQGTDTLTSNAVNTVTMSSGSKTLAHGDLICAVFEMRVYGGSGSIGSSLVTNYNTNLPTGNWFTGGSHSIDGRAPGVVIEADDGTLGYLSYFPALSNLSGETYNVNTTSGSGGDERGVIFRVERPMRVAELGMNLNPVGVAAADFEYRVYSDPLGTPTLMGSALSVLAETMSNTAAYFPYLLPYGSEYEFWPGRDYALVCRPTSTTNITLTVMTLASQAHRSCFSNGLQLRKGVRTDLTGAFTETDTIVPPFYLRESHAWSAPAPRYFLGI